MIRTHRAVPIRNEQLGAAGKLLAQAFIDDPLCVYTERDSDARLVLFTCLFAEAVRQGANDDAVYADTPAGQPSGVAVWTPPRSAEAQPDAMAANPPHKIRRRCGPAADRFFNAYRYFQRVHDKVMAGQPHWYLALLGVHPSRRGQGIGSALMIPLLRTADQQGLPCYLETFVSDNVPFYERRGFRVVNSGLEPSSHVPFWAMKRDPVRDVELGGGSESGDYAV